MATTYNQLIEFFEEIATAHKQINSFGSGLREDTEANIKKQNTYSHLYVTPMADTVNEQTNTYRIQFIICDLVKADDSNFNEVLSDTNLIAKDIIKVFRYEKSNIDLLESPTLTPFKDTFADLTAGWICELNIDCDFPNNYCDIPSEVFGNDGSECAGVSIYNGSGEIIEIVPSGGSYVCLAAGMGFVRNSDNTYSDEVEAGDTLILPDTTYIVNINGVEQFNGALPSVANHTINIS